VSLVGASGTELLTSKVFHEPRAKGATVRSLKGLLGDDVVIDDQTATATATAPKVRATRAATAETPRRKSAPKAAARAESVR
jgi:hypothetical protein